MPSLFSSTLGSASLYGLLVPMLLLVVFALLVHTSLKRPGAQLEGVGRALFSYTAQTVGILLMLTGGIPTMYSVLGFHPLGGGVYLSLLMLFAAGGLTYLWNDAALTHVDAASKAIPHAVFVCMWKLLGLTLLLVGVLSAGALAVLGVPNSFSNSWALHLGYVCAGLLLLHMHFRLPASSAFRSQPMVAAKVHKPAAAKPVKKAKKAQKRKK